MKALVTGGAASGKSAYAEQLTLALPGPYYYVATMNPAGKEAAMRIQRHRAQRAGKGFCTLESPLLASDELTLEPHATVLVEDLGNYVANNLFGATPFTVVEALDRLNTLVRKCEHLIVVTNDIGSDGIAYDKDTVRYQKFLGALSCAYAASAQLVVEVRAGIASYVKRDATCAHVARMAFS